MNREPLQIQLAPLGVGPFDILPWICLSNLLKLLGRLLAFSFRRLLWKRLASMIEGSTTKGFSQARSSATESIQTTTAKWI